MGTGCLCQKARSVSEGRTTTSHSALRKGDCDSSYLRFFVRFKLVMSIYCFYHLSGNTNCAPAFCPWPQPWSSGTCNHTGTNQDRNLCQGRAESGPQAGRHQSKEGQGWPKTHQVNGPSFLSLLEGQLCLPQSSSVLICKNE